MLHSSRTGELIYDLEVEKAARRRRQETKKRKEKQSSTTNDSEQEEYMMANNRILKELAAPDFTQQSLFITFPNLNENISFELKSGLIHLLLTFHGLSGKEPYKHLQ